MKKLLLIQPSPYEKDGKVIKKKKLYFTGLALPLLAALTPDDWETELIYEVIEDVPFDTDADLIGVSTMGHGVNKIHRHRKGIQKKRKDRHTRRLHGKHNAGGGKYCDSLIIGDAELVWQQMLSDFENGKLKKTYEKPLEGNLVLHPFPTVRPA